MSPSRSNLAAIPKQVRSRAPMNSVSTRIILCVFFSTMLTALVVSWLSIGAIHNDVRSRVEHRTRALVEERRIEIELWHAAASTQLAASTAIGTPWHSQLLSSLANLEGQVERDLRWLSSDAETTAASREGPVPIELKQPPSGLARYFDSLRLRPTGSSNSQPLECFSAKTDLIEITTKVVANLEGCLSQATLIKILDPSGAGPSGRRDGDAARAHGASGAQTPR